MACGLCVVSTDPGGIPYLLEDGQDSLVVPVNNPDAMAAAVERILDSPALTERLSGSGRRKVEGFDAPAVVSRWLNCWIRVGRETLVNQWVKTSISASALDPFLGRHRARLLSPFLAIRSRDGPSGGAGAGA